MRYVLAASAIINLNMNTLNTLQEFINLTKGIEYIIAVVFLLVFPVFWKLLDRGNSQ